MKSIVISKITLIAITLFIALTGCKKENVSTCHDGIQNQGEIGVDCGGPCAPCIVNIQDSITQKFYVQAKVDGVWITMQAPSMACSLQSSSMDTYLQSGAEFIHVQVEIPFTNLTSSDILSLEGKNLVYDVSAYEENVVVIYDVEGLLASSYFATDQAGSYFRIDKVEPDGEFWGYDSFLATGTFACKIAVPTETSDVKEVTEGRFAIRLVEQD